MRNQYYYSALAISILMGFFYAYSTFDKNFAADVWNTIFEREANSLDDVSSYLNETTVNSLRWLLKNSDGPYITIPREGRMGNCMFQYASLLGIARMNNMRPFISSPNPLFSSFDVSFDVSFVDSLDYMRGNWCHALESNFGIYDNKLERLPKCNTYLEKYLISWRYFDDVKDLIRSEFTFKTEVKKKASAKFRFHTANRFRPVVAVHVRRTDIMTGRNVQRFNVAYLTYLRKAMTYMRSYYGRVTFLVASDDVRWCRRHLKGPDVVLLHKGEAGVDMATMALCDHVIITAGTYGWWVAWLINGHTVYYRDPVRNYIRGYHPDDFFLPHWIPLI